MYYLIPLMLWLAPAYVVRFGLFGAPSNVLMLSVFLIWEVLLVYLLRKHTIGSMFGWIWSELRKPTLYLPTIFLLAGTLSLFVQGFSQDKLAQYLVLFFQPVGTYVLIRYLCSVGNCPPKADPPWAEKLPVRQSLGVGGEIGNSLTRFALLFVAVSGLYAILQYLTLHGLPPAYWGNAQEPKRALAFFIHPNFYALFVTPLLAFLLPTVTGIFLAKDQRPKTKDYLFGFAWLLGAVGLFLSLSRGGWLGLAAAAGVFLLVAGNKKLLKSALVTVIVIVIVVFTIPNFRYRLLLPFQGEKSAVSRLSLWHTGGKAVSDAPILGQGLLGFSTHWDKYNTDSGLPHHPTPHNLYLALWVDTGLLGLLSFLVLCAYALVRGLKKTSTVWQLGLALAVVALMVHGFVDTPYLKNDLALLFWLLYTGI